MSDRRCRLHKSLIRNELRRRKIRKSITMDLQPYQNGPMSPIRNNTTTKATKLLPTPPLLSPSLSSTTSTTRTNIHHYNHPKYVEQFYIKLDRTSSTFSINSNINAFCFQVQGSFGGQIAGCNTRDATTTTTTTTFEDSWQPRKTAQPVVSLQPNYNLFIQNLYFLEAIPPLRKSLYSLRVDDLRPYPEVLRESSVKVQTIKPSDAEVIFGDTIPTHSKYPRWTKSNIQWLMDLEASSGDSAACRNFEDSCYADICCMPFETNYLFFNSSY